MASVWTALTKRTQGTNIPKTWLDTIVDDLTYLYNLLGGAGASASTTLQNGSYENDSDGDGKPDGWTEVLFSGGAGAYDTTTPAHGAKAYTFTSTGGGGGYHTTDDYMVCSESTAVAIKFLLKSSAAGIRNIVRLLWYDLAKDACSTASTDIYDDAAANPTSWTEFIRGAVPPTDARFFKIRLIGADSSDTTAGSCSFDGIKVLDAGIVSCSGAIAEGTVDSISFTDAGSTTITLPTLSSASIVQLNIIGQAKNQNAGHNTSQRFRVGAQYSDSRDATGTTYIYNGFTMLLFGASGAQTLYQQLASDDADTSYTAYGKVDAYNVQARILQP